MKDARLASWIMWMSLASLGGCNPDVKPPEESGVDESGAMDEDGDGFTTDQGDCDDGDASIGPNATEVCDELDNDCDGDTDEGVTDRVYADADGDGHGDPAAGLDVCELPAGYANDGADCDDGDASVSPEAPEVCDAIDNDCDGDTDEGVTERTYRDSDGDGFGDPAVWEDACELAEGYTGDDTDCDDGDAGIYPGAEEVCDEQDNDCDALTDEGLTSTFYADFDGDGYGTAALTQAACARPEGYAENTLDCDDSDDRISPEGLEVCDGADNDCDGEIDEASALDASTWYADGDGDGYGDAGAAGSGCAQPAGYVADATDCDDGDAAAYPGATESCDGIDNDCDGTTDEDATDAATFYADGDRDGYGDARVSMRACSQPGGYVTDATDCDDGAANANPAGIEVCDLLDNDCDGIIDEADAVDAAIWYADADGDGQGDPAAPQAACAQPGGTSSNALDCDDGDVSVYAGAAEVCNGYDDDCDGLSDEAPALGSLTWYVDGDGDGFGDPAASISACAQPSGYVSDATDCDDGTADANPAEIESCDGIDNDCDGQADESSAIDAAIWYADVDGDGYGDAAATAYACAQPSGYVSDATDCDDRAAGTNPGAAEVWYDGVDQGCDGGSDYDQDGDGDDSDLYGGDDCDDTDPARFGGYECRPAATCTRPALATMEQYDPLGSIDLVYDASCNAYISNVVGLDWVRVLTPSGAYTDVSTYGNYNLPALDLIPGTTTIVAAGNDNAVHWALRQSGTSLARLVQGTYATGTNWSAVTYLNRGTPAVAAEASRMWVPNFAGNGTLVAVTYAGAASTLTTLGARVEGIDLRSDGQLLVSSGANVYLVDPSTGASSIYLSLGETALDLVVDYNDDVYVETASDRIWHYDASAGTTSVFAAVTGDGKLAISPDGWLVRLSVYAGSCGSYCYSNYSEWELQ